MANTFLTSAPIAKEALALLENNCVMGSNVHRQYKKEFVKVGDTVSIRRPVKFEEGQGADVSARLQDITEMSTSIVIDQHWNIAFPVSSVDMTLKVEKFGERYLKPAMSKLGNRIDYTLTGLYNNVYGAAGVAGSTPNSFSDLADLGTLMDNMCIPDGDRKLVVNPTARWSLADALKGTFETKGASDFLRKGFLGHIAGLDIMQDQNIRLHTHNTLTGTPLIDTVSGATYTTGDTAIYSTVNIDGISAGDLEAGDIFTIAGVNSVNPQNGQDTGSLQQFTVLADVDQATDMAVTVYPAIRASGAYKTVTAAPADGAAVTFLNSHRANLAFNKNAFALVMVPFEKVGKGVDMSTQEYNGFAITVTLGFDITTFKYICRLDVLFGVKCIYPEYAVRLLG